MKIHNCFDFEVKDCLGRIVKTAHAENIVLNQYFDRIVKGYRCFNAIHVGTGIEEPVASNTQLSEYVAGKNADFSGVSVDWDNMIFSLRKSIVFQADELVDQVLTEVGIAHSVNDGTLCTHALIRDENGNVSSITKNSTEILTIHATVFADLSAVEKNGIYIQRYANASNISSANILPYVARWALGDVSVDSVSADCLAYDYTNTNSSGSYTCTISAEGNTTKILHPDITVNQYNDIALKVIKVFGKNSLCMTVPNANFTQPQITNEVIATGDGSTTEYNTKFSFIKYATVKVDGVEVSDITVNAELPQCAEQCFELYDYPRTYSSDEENATTPIMLLTCGGWSSAVSGAWSIYENKYYSKGVHIKKCKFALVKIFLSNDLTTWTEIQSDQVISESLQNARYWKIENNSSTYIGLYDIIWTRPADIIFSEPPAEGSEITIDYMPDCIAKDSDHILRGIEFNFTFSG